MASIYEQVAAGRQRLREAGIPADQAGLDARLIAQRNRLRLLPWSFVALAGGLVSLWLLLHLDVPWVFGLLILFSKQFKTVAMLVFWTTIGDLVDGRQAKRLYGPLTPPRLRA